MGGRDSIVGASLRTQEVFKEFEILRLRAPMRQANDPAFAEWLDTIGDDHEHEDVDLGRLAHTNSVDEVVDFVFPHSILSQPEECMQRAILSPYNDYVAQLNEKVLEQIPGEERVYFSSDSIEDDGVQLGASESPLATPEFLNAHNEPGIPPHELHLKVGSICRFMRNFMPAKGITKNTRVIVTRMLRHSVEVRTIPTLLGGRRVDAVSPDRQRCDSGP
jgi:ATP-dependent DNA helicase PIF1